MRGKKATIKERPYYLGMTAQGKVVEIPCPNGRRCGDPTCLKDRGQCTFSGEDSTPVTVQMRMKDNSPSKSNIAVMI